VLAAAELPGSMGRVASGGVNAAMESLHALLQRTSWTPPLAHRDEMRQSIVSATEHIDSRHRCRQSALGTLTPVEYYALHRPGR
jgi:putative transposase